MSPCTYMYVCVCVYMYTCRCIGIDVCEFCVCMHACVLYVIDANMKCAITCVHAIKHGETCTCGIILL